MKSPTCGYRAQVAAPRHRGLRLGWLRTTALLGAVLASLAQTQDLAAQQTGRIVGRVTDSQSGAPIGEVQVFIAGTGLGTLTR